MNPAPGDPQLRETAVKSPGTVVANATMIQILPEARAVSELSAETLPKEEHVKKTLVPITSHLVVAYPGRTRGRRCSARIDGGSGEDPGCQTGPGRKSEDHGHAKERQQSKRLRFPGRRR